MNEEKKEDVQEENDVLEQVKKVEKSIKAKILIDKIGELKKHAKQINELKECSIATLEELQLSKADVKRIIDYINELPDVKLTEREKADIREDVDDEMKDAQQKNENIFRNADIKHFLHNLPTAGFCADVDYALLENVSVGADSYTVTYSGTGDVGNTDTFSVRL